MERGEVGAGSTFRIEQADVVLEAFPDETIAVHLGTGRYFSIDLVGAEMVALLASGNEVGAIVAHLASRYDAEPAVVEGALTDFAGRLLDEGLIRAAPDGQVDAALPDAARASTQFTPPTISAYSDMQDLLLLDPIHDVDETGWPVRADASEGDTGAPRTAE